MSTRPGLFPISWSETDQVSNAKTFKVGWIALKTLLRWRAGSPERADRKAEDYAFRALEP